MQTPQFSSSQILNQQQVDELDLLTQRGQIQRVLLGKLTGANFNSLVDQAIRIYAGNYIIREIVVTNASVSLTTAIGGIYGASAKASPIVAAEQVYSALTGASKYLELTLVPSGDVRTVQNIYLSLSTIQGQAATADVYVFGDILD